MKNVIKSLFFLSSAHLYIYSVELQRPLSKINPDRCLGVRQESTPAESVRQTRLSNIWIADDYYLKDPRLRAVIVVVWGELQGVVQTDNGAEVLPRFVFYCHCSCSRGPDVDNMEISRELQDRQILPTDLKLVHSPIGIWSNLSFNFKIFIDQYVLFVRPIVVLLN